MKKLTKQTVRKEFIKFLKEHNVLIPFLCNLAIGQWSSIHENHRKPRSLTQLIEIKPPHSLILHSFEWDDTSEDFEFWDKLHWLWRQRIDPLIRADNLYQNSKVYEHA